MSRRLYRLWLLPALLLASQSWALGLGDIRLNSALNEPLRAEIDLLSATDEELKNLNIQLASDDTFSRYDLDRPLFLTTIRFEIVRSGTGAGIVRITSADPVTEPFITFLVEAVWSRGRMLREYTLLLDPPTFAPPPVTQTRQAVAAPTQSNQADRGPIERATPQPAPPRQAAPVAPRTTPQPVAPAPQAAPQPAPETPASETPAPVTPVVNDTPAPADQPAFNTVGGGDLVVQRGDTLWGIARRVRPDSRLTVQQTMLAIYETNPQAFAGNINRMSAGASLRIPSADDVFRISRNEAVAEVQRQNDAWRGGSPGVAPQPQQSLTLVPPDEDVELFDEDAGQLTTEPGEAVVDTIDPDEARISEIEAQLVDHQNSVIEITDNELAVLRAELAALRGEEIPVAPVAAPPVAEEPPIVVEDPVVDPVEDTPPEDITTVVDEDVAAETPAVVVDAPPRVSVPPADDGIVATLLGYLGNFWVLIGAAIVAALGLLFWFARRPGQSDDEESTGMWEALDAEEIDSESAASTERLRAMARDDDTAIVVVEQDSPTSDALSMDTLEVPAGGLDAGSRDDAEDDFVSTTALDRGVAPTAIAASMTAAQGAEAPAVQPQMDAGPSIEDTFSSDTAINLDQSDPIAEADFHMAYGLYDQAADLINGALEIDPENQDLLAKLCEIYFVWGNRDAFIESAGKMHALTAGQPNAEWDKIVIMGQQIASDHELFSGVSAGAASREVDMDFADAGDDAGVLDLELGSGDHNDMIDLSDDTGLVPIAEPTAEFEFDIGSELTLDDTATREAALETEEIAAIAVTEQMPAISETEEIPAIEAGDTVESPTIEQPFESIEVTQEMPGAATIGPNDATEMASLDDLDNFDDTPSNDETAEIDLDDLDLDLVGLDDLPISGDDDAADFEATQETRELSIGSDLEETGKNPELSDSLAATGKNPALPEDLIETDAGLEFDPALLDATGQTNVLDPSVLTDDSMDGSPNEVTLSDDEKTMLANLDDDDDDATTLGDASEFEISAADAAPDDALTVNIAVDETGEMPGVPGTDMDLDLDDLTAALQVSEIGDTVARKHFADDAATVEQPMIRPDDADSDTSSTGLHDARTMTEVGTKLDLARAYVDMGDPSGARSILEEVLDEGDDGQRQQAQQLLETLPS